MIDGETALPVRTINLNGTRVTDDDLDFLKLFPLLSGLSLDQTHITDAGLAKLNKNVQLRYLSAQNTKITGLAFRELSDLQHLKRVVLFLTPITDVGVEQLAALPSIRELFFGTNITDAALSHIAQMRQLRLLAFYDANLADSHVKSLKNLPALTDLRLYKTQITDAGLEELSHLTQLKGLELDGTQITDAGVERLTRLPHLQLLSIADTRVSDHALQTLLQIPSLKLVRVANSAITRGGIAAFRDLHPLPPIDNSFRTLQRLAEEVKAPPRTVHTSPTPSQHKALTLPEKKPNPQIEDQSRSTAKRLTLTEAPLVGTWEKSTFASFVRLTLRDDHTFETMTNFNNLAQVSVQNGSWQLHEDTLKLEFDNADESQRKFGPPEQSLVDLSNPRQIELIWIDAPTKKAVTMRLGKISTPN